MIILGIDASMKISSVAVANYNNDNINILASSVSDGIIPHSESLLPMIDSVLKACGSELAAVDFFAVTAGPGSFTGIRIGVATLKGLAFGRVSCCAGVSTLDALCLSIPVQTAPRYIVAPLIDARRNQVYNALYMYDNGSVKKITADRIILLPDLLEGLDAPEFVSIPVYFCGDIKFPFAGMGECFNFIPFGNVAESVCRVAVKNSFIDPVDLAPRYLIKTQAEREYLERGDTVL